MTSPEIDSAVLAVTEASNSRNVSEGAGGSDLENPRRMNRKPKLEGALLRSVAPEMSETTRPRGDARPRAERAGRASRPPPDAAAPLLISLFMLIPFATSISFSTFTSNLMTL